LCLFGEDGYDLWIEIIANNQSDNSSNLGRTYQLPEGIKYNSELAKSFLAGSYRFKVKQLEVF